MALGLCKDGQKILDLGTGTGVLPRNMYSYGGKWIGTDISEEQIEQAKHLSVGMNIDYKAVAAEKIDLPAESFMSLLLVSVFGISIMKALCQIYTGC